MAKQMPPTNTLDMGTYLIEGLVQLDRSVQANDPDRIERCTVFYKDRASYAARMFGDDFPAPYNAARDIILNNEVREM